MKKYIDNNEIRLYSLLIDELFRHQNTIWQIPTALLVANFIVLINYQCNSAFLTVLWLFNAGMLYVLGNMIISQRKIVDTIDKAEKKLKSKYSDYLPQIKSNKLFYPPYLFLGILILLQIIFAIYIGLLYSHCIICHEIVDNNIL